MKIAGGRRRGRRLKVPPGSEMRPTAGRTREAVFNILIHGIDGGDPEGQVVLDAFAGVGAMGLEALSRGADHAIFIDSDPAASAAARTNAGAMGEAQAVTLLTMDATRPGPPPFSAKAPAGLVFLDPPYHSGLAASALEALAAQGWIAEGAVTAVELAAKEDFTPPAGFTPLDERRYGAARIVFLRRAVTFR